VCVCVVGCMYVGVRGFVCVLVCACLCERMIVLVYICIVYGRVVV